jgi:hypothetical protein
MIDSQADRTHPAMTKEERPTRDIYTGPAEEIISTGFVLLVTAPEAASFRLGLDRSRYQPQEGGSTRENRGRLPARLHGVVLYFAH